MSAPISSRRALREGATQASLPAVLGAVLVCLGLWLTCALTLTEEVVASGALISTPNDDYAALASAAMRSRFGSQGGGSDVVIIGSSATREAITSAEDLSARVALRGAAPPQVTLLTAGDLTPIEALAVVDQIPSGLRGVAVLEVSARTLGATPSELAQLIQDRRLPLRSPSQAAALSDLGVTLPPVVDNYFLQNYAFFLARPQALRALFGQRVKPELHQSDNLPLPTDADWARLSARLHDWLVSVEDPPPGLRVMARLIDELKAHGLRVLLLDAPRNPALLATLARDPAVAAGRGRVEMAAGVLSKGRGAKRINPTATAQLAGGDFIDHCHITSIAAREAFTEALADAVSPVLKRVTAVEPK